MSARAWAAVQPRRLTLHDHVLQAFRSLAANPRRQHPISYRHIADAAVRLFPSACYSASAVVFALRDLIEWGELAGDLERVRATA